MGHMGHRANPASARHLATAQGLLLPVLSRPPFTLGRCLPGQGKRTVAELETETRCVLLL